MSQPTWQDPYCMKDEFEQAALHCHNAAEVLNTNRQTGLVDRIVAFLLRWMKL